MKRLIAALLVLGFCGTVDAEKTSVERSTRSFRLDQTTGVVYADLVVAYQPPPNKKWFASLDEQKIFLVNMFKSASLELFVASKGAVQLGQITIIPATVGGSVIKADPDLVIVTDLVDPTDPDQTDPTKFKCPTGIERRVDVKNSEPVCADAHTGGYLGVAWWRDLDKTTLGATQPIFHKTMDDGVTPVNSKGAHIAVSWSTLKKQGATVLVHEFGHYLFAMRDEYEGLYFQQTDASLTLQQEFENATAIMPDKSVSGSALVGGVYPATQRLGIVSAFEGYGMSLFSKYDRDRGYSPVDLDIDGVLTAQPEAVETIMDISGDAYAVTEQIASVGTRGAIGDIPGKARHGGMWSLATSIRTSLGKSYTPVSFLNSSTGKVDESKLNTTTEGQVEFYADGQSNIFVFDRSGSMDLSVTGTQSTASGVTRWDAAVDFFGLLTNAKTANYTAGANFGFIAFDDQLETPVVYPSPLAPISAFTTDYVAGSPDKKLKYMSSAAPNAMPYARGATDLLAALEQAKTWLNTTSSTVPVLPVQRNVILISDGIHNYDSKTKKYVGSSAFVGNEALLGKYRVFSISVDNDLADRDYGDKMQKLALSSVGPEGAHGFARYTDGDHTTTQIVQYANEIMNEIQQKDNQSFPPTDLYADGGGQDYSLSVDRGQTSAQFAIAYAGNYAPTLYLTLPNNQTFTENSSARGITFKNGKNIKTFDIDLTEFPIDPSAATANWKLKATAPQAPSAVTIFPTLATKSSKLAVDASFDPLYVSTTGRLPVTVVVQDGRPIQGLQVNATLVNRLTGVTRSIPMAWNGAAYTGLTSGNLQAGVNTLTFDVVHPNNGKVFYAQGENRLADADRTPYPYFAPRPVTRQVWVPGAAVQKSVPGLEVWTINTNPRNAQGTTLKLFVKNGTSVPLTGLKVRYFFSVSEFSNGVPAISPMYLPMSRASVGTVSGRPGLAYVEFDFGALTLQPGASSSYGQNTGEGLSVIEAQWRSPWNTANDWSAQGLKTTWSVNNYVNVYKADGTLIAGNPDLEPVGFIVDAKPIVSLDAPDLVAVGMPASFQANAVDPEGEDLTYTWTVDGVAATPNPGNPAQLVYTFGTAGAHTVQLVVWDGHSSRVVIDRALSVQSASGACTESNSFDLGAVNVNFSVNLMAGTNCFVIRSASLVREWKWSNVYFQANSDNGVALNGLSVSPVGGSATNLSGYSQTVPYANPTATSLYLKIQAPSMRTVRLNWWLQ